MPTVTPRCASRNSVRSGASCGPSSRGVVCKLVQSAGVSVSGPEAAADAPRPYPAACDGQRNTVGQRAVSPGPAPRLTPPVEPASLPRPVFPIHRDDADAQAQLTRIPGGADLHLWRRTIQLAWRGLSRRSSRPVGASVSPLDGSSAARGPDKSPERCLKRWRAPTQRQTPARPTRQPPRACSASVSAWG